MRVVLFRLPETRGVRLACCWIPEMPLSDSQVRALKAGERNKANLSGIP